eukprot:30986-Pelagococcus_subviridis.AAC.14
MPRARASRAFLARDGRGKKREAPGPRRQLASGKNLERRAYDGLVSYANESEFSTRKRTNDGVLGGNSPG